MTEILTESFCERCGTRYTFESGNRKRGRLGKVRTLSKGLRNYVLSDESTLSEAFADARSDDTQSVSADQLDAFHRTFNFCMSCRQYTCANCWNEPEGRCLSCAPHLGTEILPAAFPDLDPYAGSPTNGHLDVEELETNGHVADDLAWPEIDLPSARIARALGDEELPEAEPAAAEAMPDPAVELIGASEVGQAERPEAGDAIAALAAAEAIDAVADAEPWRIEGLVRPVEADADEPVVEADATPVVEPVAPEAAALAAIAAVEAEAADEPVEAVAAPEAVEAVEVEPEPAVAEAADAAAEAEPDAPVIVPRIVPRSAASRSVAPDERAAAAAAQTSALLAKFRPGQSLDDAIAAYEAELAKARGVEPDDLDMPAELRAMSDEPSVEAAAIAAPAPVAEPEALVEAEAEVEAGQAVAEPEPIVAAPEPVLAEAEAEPEPMAVEPEVVIAAAAIAAPETDHDAEGDHEAARIAAIAAAAAAAAATVGHEVAAIAPIGHAEVAHPEHVAATPAPEPEPEPVAAEAAPEPEPEPAKPEPQPQPVAAEAAPAPAAPKVDIVEQPAWRIVAPDAPSETPASPWPVTPTPPTNGQPQYPVASADPQWPAPGQNGAPQWPNTPAPYVPSRTAQPAVGRIGSRTVVRGADEIWAASNQEVLAKAPATGAAIAPCRSCGLSLSANARFCRRCGTRQG